MTSSQRAYYLGWIAVVLGAISAIAVLHLTGMFIDYYTLLLCDGIILLLFAVHFYSHRQKSLPTLSLISGCLGIMLTCAVLAGIVANAGMRLNFPFIDSQLSAMDRLLGIDTPAIVITISRWPLLANFLGVAYTSIFYICFIAPIILALQGQHQRVWELSTGFGACIVIAAIISVAFPALGNFVEAEIQHLAGEGLPKGAGIYHLHAVEKYRNGTIPLLDITKLEGVVTFPSFHMVMAIIVAYGFRLMGAISWAVYVWSALVAISTIPIGGHYVIDLVGGAALWTGMRYLWRAENFRSRSPTNAAVASLPQVKAT